MLKRWDFFFRVLLISLQLLHLGCLAFFEGGGSTEWEQVKQISRHEIQTKVLISLKYFGSLKWSHWVHLCPFALTLIKRFTTLFRLSLSKGCSHLLLFFFGRKSMFSSYSSICCSCSEMSLLSATFSICWLKFSLWFESSSKNLGGEGEKVLPWFKPIDGLGEFEKEMSWDRLIDTFLSRRGDALRGFRCNFNLVSCGLRLCCESLRWAIVILKEYSG